MTPVVAARLAKPVSPLRRLGLVVEARREIITSGLHEQFRLAYALARAAAMAYVFHQSRPVPLVSGAIPIIGRDTLPPRGHECGLLCGAIGCGRLICRDGSIAPIRDTGFRMIRKL